MEDICEYYDSEYYNCDSGFQMTFTSKKARNQLNLKTVRKQNISVKCFGKNENMKKLDRVKFWVIGTSEKTYELEQVSQIFSYD